MPYAMRLTPQALLAGFLLQAVAHETGPVNPAHAQATAGDLRSLRMNVSHIGMCVVISWVLTSAFSAIYNGLTGTYRLMFAISDSFSDIPPDPAIMLLRIIPCPKGYATASTGDACIPCVKGYFSFNPSANECSTCVPNAFCPGGATVWPAKGFFHSAPQSIQMHR